MPASVKLGAVSSKNNNQQYEGGGRGSEPAGEAQLECGGAEMLTVTEAVPEGAKLDPALAQGSLIGKRYVDADERYELLCTKAGAGSLAIGDERLRLKEAKPLPSSD